MKFFSFALVGVLFASTAAANAQTATPVEPEQVYSLAMCEAAALAQVRTYSALAAMMNGASGVAIDDTTSHFLDRTADSFSTYAQTRLKDAQTMDSLAKRIMEGSPGYESYKLVVERKAQELNKKVIDGAFGPLPSSGPTSDLARETDRCYDLFEKIEIEERASR